MENTSDFLLKRHSQNKVFISKFVSNWTPGCTIQGVIVLVISNWPRAAFLSDFEIACLITLSSYHNLSLQ